MKKIICILLLAFGMNVKAQVMWEHTYDSASTTNGNNQLMIVKFEVSGERYVKVNRQGLCIGIYDMNHSLIKNISLANLPLCYGDPGDILYLSEHLFNEDDRMEFMSIRSACGASSPYYLTNIYSEDGTIIFSDTGAAEIRTNYEQQQMPIYNTSVGTKMILSYRNGQAKVFSLPGTLTTAIAQANNQLIQQQSELKLSNPYPNPNNNSTTIDYTLPQGINQGEIVFYNLQGAEVKRFKVDRTFSNLLISTSDIAAGTYYYQLQTNKENSGGRKMVVIK